MRYLVRRFCTLVLTCWVALTVNFALPRLMPGNPAETMFARYQGTVSPAAISIMELNFGLNTKTGELGQYFDYLGHTLTGNLGLSFSFFPAHVSTLIGEALPWTLGLVGFATIVAFLLGTTLGMVAAWRRGTAGWRRASLVDSALVPFGLMLGALPSFWIALMLLYFIGFKFGWFPIGYGLNPGEGIATWSGFVSLIDHAALPAITLTFISMGGWILLMRNNMLTVLGDDYVKFAVGQGLARSARSLTTTQPATPSCRSSTSSPWPSASSSAVNSSLRLSFPTQGSGSCCSMRWRTRTTP